MNPFLPSCIVNGELNKNDIALGRLRPSEQTESNQGLYGLRLLRNTFNTEMYLQFSSQKMLLTSILPLYDQLPSESVEIPIVVKTVSLNGKHGTTTDHLVFPGKFQGTWTAFSLHCSVPPITSSMRSRS